MVGWILTKKEKKKGRVRDPDVFEFVEHTVLFSPSVIGGLGEAVFALRHTLRGLSGLWPKEVHLFQNSTPYLGGLWFFCVFVLASLHCTFQEPVTTITPRRKQLVFGFRCCDRIHKSCGGARLVSPGVSFSGGVVYSMCME